ncbi:serine hydrolase [Neolewinella aurantiaca]|uniref:Serine hydrolase n=1 Tax=Neolewinella aurantiaca TaxID=2602767 RepID=A0A5C7FK17_9BACT|nr:serine hydrolase [Neolewinella aurantiaca]TXF91688.1 serine hydrolase [Neolewinella aurantiaca]
MYRFLLFPLLLLTACTEQSPSLPLELSRGEIIDDFHQGQIGQIRFFNDWVNYEDFGPEDFITTLHLNEATEFNARMFLDKTITSYLHDLAPEMTVEELCAAGSFQFTFLVDGQETYVYNLQTGAGSCDYKNEATVFGIPWFGEKEQDHWGRFLWVKFMKLGGGEAALSQGVHNLTIEVRPYLQAEDLKTGPLIARGSIRVVAQLPEVSPTDVAVHPIAATDRFPVAAEPLRGEPVKTMNAKIARGQFSNITSVVVLKNGEILLEEYFNGADRGTLHDTRSVGKSFAGAVTGLALKDGHLKDVNQPISDFYDLSKFANPSPLKSGTTIHQLLTMTSGLDSNDSRPDSPGQEEKMYVTDDWAKFVLDLPARKDSGWSYCSAGTVLLGDILQQTLPGGLEAYAEKELFTPLGITDQKWQYTPTGVGNTAGSLKMSALSLAAFGQLYLDGGKGIFPADWATISLQPQVARNDEKGGHYGYLFWHDAIESEGTTYTYAHASGNGGNKIVMIEELNVVIIITATAYNKPYAHWQAGQILSEHLLPALR